MSSEHNKSTRQQQLLLASMDVRNSHDSIDRGDARAITANGVSMTMPSLSRSFQSPDVRHSFLYHAAMISHRAGVGIVQQHNTKGGHALPPDWSTG